MLEENKERLSKTEYDKIGDMLLELMGDCPYIPKDAKIKYNALEVGKCVAIIAVGDGTKKPDVTGGYSAKLTLRIWYQSFASTNGEMIDAQAVVENIVNWLDGIKKFPKLANDWMITKITAGVGLPEIVEAKDKTIVYGSNVVMEYEVE